MTTTRYFHAINDKRRAAAPEVQFYDRQSIDQCQWPNTRSALMARYYLEPMIKHGTRYFIDNVDVELRMLVINQKILPITFSQTTSKNCFIASLISQYIDYPRRSRAPQATQAITWILTKLGFDDVVFVNNWLLPTVITPTFTSDEMDQVCDFLATAFPNRALVMRDLTHATDRPLMNMLKKWHLIAGRTLYICPQNEKKNTRDRIADRKHLATTHLDIHSAALQAEDLFRLYNALNLDKHTQLNPHYTVRFFETAVRQHLFSFKTLALADKTVAFAAFRTDQNILTAPLVGYDPTLPKSLGLYRLLSAIVDQQKGSSQHLQGAGSGQFKINRGATGHLSYCAIYSQHLSIGRRMLWLLFRGVVSRWVRKTRPFS